MRNTAPAIGLAALHLLQEDPEAMMAVMPSDHLVTKTTRFWICSAWPKSPPEVVSW